MKGSIGDRNLQVKLRLKYSGEIQSSSIRWLGFDFVEKINEGRCGDINREFGVE
jgi:hypothetical protein